MSKTSTKKNAVPQMETHPPAPQEPPIEENYASIEAFELRSTAPSQSENLEREGAGDSFALFSPELREEFSPTDGSKSEPAKPLIPLNSVMLVGRVGTAVDIRYFESGKAVAKGTLAVKRPTKNSDQPDWFDWEAWNEPAILAANYVTKGRLIGIQGYLKIESWFDQNYGCWRSKPVIKVNRIELLDSKSSREEQEG